MRLCAATPAALRMNVAESSPNQPATIDVFCVGCDSDSDYERSRMRLARYFHVRPQPSVNRNVVWCCQLCQPARQHVYPK